MAGSEVAASSRLGARAPAFFRNDCICGFYGVWPVLTHSGPQRGIGNSPCAGILRQIQSLAFMLYEHYAGLVGVLLGEGRPSAILRGVVAIVVDAVKAGSCRLFAHVRKEVGEAFHPPGAHRYAAPAVSIIVPPIRVEAPAFGSAPRSIRGRNAVDSMAVSNAAGFGVFAEQASAASLIAVPNPRNCYLCGVATVALKFPNPLPIFNPQPANCDQAAVTLACNVQGTISNGHPDASEEHTGLYLISESAQMMFVAGLTFIAIGAALLLLDYARFAGM